VIDQLNLASQPFRNRTLPWTVAVTLSLASVLALILIISAGREAQARADRVETDVRELRQREHDLRAKVEAVNATLTPEQRLVLAAAHEIVDRKNFSWSRLLADLEGTLPATVRVARIAVRDTRQVNGQTRAELELTVVGRTPADITRMIGEMARAGIFSANLLTQQPRTAKGEPGVEATLRVYYTPSASGPVKPQAEETPARVATATTTNARGAGETP
jgi:outer membrane murein-binding lipoprotein Lpp